MRLVAAIAGVVTMLAAVILVVAGLVSPSSAHSKAYNAVVIVFDIAFLLSIIPGTIHAFKNRVTAFIILFPLLLVLFLAAPIISMTTFCLPLKYFLIFDSVTLAGYLLFFLTQFRKG